MQGPFTRVFGGSGAFSRGGGGGFLPFRDGTLGVNLAFIRNYAPAVPTLNLFKMANNWAAWDGSTGTALGPGDINATGYPTTIPGGAINVRCGFAWNGPEFDPLKNRNIVAVTTGDATWTIGGNVSISSSSANRIVFQVTGTAWRLEVTDLGTTGVGSAYAVFEEYESLLLAGELWNPKWLSLLRRDYNLLAPFQMRDLRFMDWMQTNSSDVVNYSDHPALEDFRWWSDSNNPNYNGRGAPILAMINLCNKVGANFWPCIPHRATDAYVTAFAADVRDNLNSNLKCLLEYSNETWNTGIAFRQSFYTAARGINDWGTPGTGTITTSGTTVTGTGTAFTTEVSVDDYLAGPDGAYLGRVASIASDTSLTVSGTIGDSVTDAAFSFDPNFYFHDWTAKRAVQVAYLFDQEFGNVARRKHVLGTQYSSTGVTNTRLAAAVWLAQDGEATGGDPSTGWVDPKTVFDYIATGAYWGNSAIADADWAAIATAYDLAPDDGADLVADAVDADTGATAISEAANTMKAQYDVAREAGLEVIQYEGGQHLSVPGAATSGQQASITDAIRLYFTKPRAAAHLASWGLAVKAYTDGPVNWFNLDGEDSDVFGTWGLFPSLGFAGDEKTAFVNEIAQDPRWFGNDTPPVFLGALPELTGQETLGLSVDLRHLFSANYGTPTITGIDGVSMTAAGSTTGAPMINGTGTYTITLTNPAGATSATGTYDFAVAPTLPVPEMVTFDGATVIASTALTGRAATTKMTGLVKYQRTATTNGTIFGAGTATSPFDILAQNNTIRLRLYNTGNTNFYTFSGGSGLSDGNPHFFEWSYDGDSDPTNGLIKIAIDGVTVVDTTTTKTTLRGASWQPAIGATSPASPATFYAGDIERVAVWDNVALDVLDSAVRANMRTLNLAGSLGNNIIDVYGPPATINAGTQQGTGGTFNSISGAVT